MKVALLSHFWHPIAEPFVGGTEAFLFRFATALLQRGIEVVCYGCEGSNIPGTEMRTLDVSHGELAPLQRGMSGSQMIALRDHENAVMWAAIDDACNDPSIDIVHNNSFSPIPLFLSTLIQKPILHTLHLPPVIPTMAEAIRFCHKRGRLLQLVAGSQAHARSWHAYHPGRIDPTKGVEDAIAVAALLGKHLDIYGIVQPPLTSYFETHIQPLLQTHPNVTYHGLVSQTTLLQGLSGAQALLFPIKWDEPFGYVTIEAMSVGTPVIMYDRGAARELIVEEMNGFIVTPDNVQEMAAAVERTKLIDRARCAVYAREQYTIAKSVEEYLGLFTSLLKESSQSASRVFGTVRES